MKKNQAQVNLQKTTLFVFKSKKNDGRSVTDPTMVPTATVTFVAGAKN
jgi:hypothetical protein